MRSFYLGIAAALLTFGIGSAAVAPASREEVPLFVVMEDGGLKVTKTSIPHLEGWKAHSCFVRPITKRTATCIYTHGELGNLASVVLQEVTI